MLRKCDIAGKSTTSKIDDADFVIDRRRDIGLHVRWERTAVCKSKYRASDDLSCGNARWLRDLDVEAC